MMKRMIIASTSTVYGSGYLEYLMPALEVFFKKTDCILFIPYARPGGMSYDAYTEIAGEAFRKIGKEVKGIHEFENCRSAVHEAKAVFVGGGNTFLLVKTLYENNLMNEIRKEVIKGTLYLGTSAGSNITGPSMQTTNDMPIVYPPSFDTLGLIGFNLNPHYLDPDPDSKHKGETRETRIKEFHQFNDIPVLGLREGSWLEVDGDKIFLKGNLKARLFQKGKTPEEIPSGSRVDHIL